MSMTDDVEVKYLLDVKAGQAAINCDLHFNKLIDAAKRELPEEIHYALPQGRRHLAGLFTPEANRISLTVVSDIPGYYDIDAYFEFSIEEDQWKFQYYALLPPTKLLQLMSQEIRFKSFDNAAFASRFVKQQMPKDKISNTEQGAPNTTVN